MRSEPTPPPLTPPSPLTPRWLTLALCALLAPLAEALTHLLAGHARAALASFGLTAALSAALAALFELTRRFFCRAHPLLRPRSAPEGWGWALAAALSVAGVLLAAQVTLPAAHRSFRREEYQALAVGLAALAAGLLSLIITPPLGRALGKALHAAGERLCARLPLLKAPLAHPLAALALGALALERLDHLRALHTLDLRPLWLAGLWLWGQVWGPRVAALCKERWREVSRAVSRRGEGRVKGAASLGVALCGPCVLVLCGLWVAAWGLTHASALRLERHGVAARGALHLARLLSDRDKDGAAALWLGGDCDDADPAVRPGAPEAPGQERGCDGHPREAKVERRGLRARPPRRPGAEEGERAEHLIMITLDAVRADSYERHMPQTRAFAERAVRFTNAYSAGATTYWSLPALLGSKPPSAFRMERDQTPALGERLLLEALRDGGLHTALLSNVTIFFVRGLGQGAQTKNFDTSHFTRHGERFGAAHMTKNILTHVDRWRAGRLAPQRPRLALWAHYYDAHDPYFKVKGEPSGEGDRERYEAILRAMDKELGALFRGLEERGLLESTAVLLTADHGDEFGEHGGRFHGQSLYEEMTRVPLWLYSPTLSPRVVGAPVSHLDVAPTLLDLLGLPPEGSFWGGSLLAAGEEQRERVFFELLPDSNYGRHAVGAREGRWKLIYDLKTGRLELYDLQEDPQEQLNLADRFVAGWRVGGDAPLLALYRGVMSYAEEM